jgi:hypothetical protein
MDGFRTLACMALAGLALAPAGCGGNDPSEGLLSNVDKARNAASMAALQTGLVAVALVRADSPGGTAESLVPALQAKDPTNRYTTGPPSAPGIVQVLGGGGGPVMLVSLNSGPEAGRPPFYVAAWQGAGSSKYYVGQDPPVYAAEPPAGPGWSTTLPQ